MNYYFYSDLLKQFKFINKKIVYNNYIRNTNNFLSLLPSYTFKSQFFMNRSIFNDLLLNSKLKGFFLYKNYFNILGYKNNLSFYKKHLIGYNFYIYNNMYKNYSQLIPIMDDKEYNTVGKVKILLTEPNIYNFKLTHEFSTFFNFNVFLLNLVELYKISFLLYLNTF